MKYIKEYAFWNKEKVDTLKVDTLKKDPTDIDRFKAAYAQYWDIVKDSVDDEGWVYSKELPHLTDAYFEFNTKKEIQIGNYGEKGRPWRPKELSIFGDKRNCMAYKISGQI